MATLCESKGNRIEVHVPFIETKKHSPNTGAHALIKGALCVYVIRLRVSHNQNDETLSQNSLRYLRNANLPIAVH